MSIGADLRSGGREARSQTTNRGLLVSGMTLPGEQGACPWAVLKPPLVLISIVDEFERLDKGVY